jgi:hypothetical protein
MVEECTIFPLTKESLTDLIDGNVKPVNSETAYFVDELRKTKEFLSQNIPKLQQLQKDTETLAKEVELMNYRFRTLQIDLRNIWPIPSVSEEELRNPKGNS